MKKVSSIALLALGFTALSACSQETSTNTDRRERDRANEKTQVIADEYAKAAGSYTGHIASGSVSLDVKIAWDHDTGAPGAGATTTPQPVLVGVLKIYPDVDIAGTEPLQVSLPIDSGTYSDETKNMTLIFKAGDATSRLVCDLTDTAAVACKWFTGNGLSSVTLAKLADGTQSAAPSQTQGQYVGQTADFDIHTSLQTAYSAPSSGQGMRTLVLARFTFTDRHSTLKGDRGVEFTSQTGAYDPQTDSFSFSLAGDTPILVNCKRLARTHLACQWNSIRSYNFDLNAVESSDAVE